MKLAQRHVSEIMRHEVATLAPDDTLDLGDDIMNLGRVRHMPVLDGVQLVGMVSRRDVLAASLSRALDFEPASRRSFLSSVEVAEVMTKEVITVSPETTLSEAAELLIERRVGALPVVEPGGGLVGLVTETDLLAEAYGVAADEEEKIEVSKATEFSEWLEGELGDLRRARDELRVQAHLAKAEVRDRWAEAEKGLSSLEGRAKRTARAAEKPLQQLQADARKLVADLRESYRQIRKAL
jgi:CBS domain-containing protein